MQLDNHEHNFHFMYRKVASTNTSCLEADPGFLRLLMKEEKFDAYVLRTFGEKLIWETMLSST